MWGARLGAKARQAEREIEWKKVKGSRNHGQRKRERDKQTCAVLRVLGCPSSRDESQLRGGTADVRAASRGQALAREGGERKQNTVSGDNSLRDPPVPIPNTEVKPQHAESTWLETAR